MITCNNLVRDLKVISGLETIEIVYTQAQFNIFTILEDSLIFGKDSEHDRVTHCKLKMC